MSSDIPGDCFLIEQKDLFSQLINQTEDNPDEVDLEAVIQR